MKSIPGRGDSRQAVAQLHEGVAQDALLPPESSRPEKSDYETSECL
jgi:hypothetical protein